MPQVSSPDDWVWDILVSHQTDAKWTVFHPDSLSKNGEWEPKKNILLYFMLHFKSWITHTLLRFFFQPIPQQKVCSDQKNLKVGKQRKRIKCNRRERFEIPHSPVAQKKKKKTKSAGKCLHTSVPAFPKLICMWPTIKVHAPPTPST